MVSEYLRNSPLPDSHRPRLVFKIEFCILMFDEKEQFCNFGRLFKSRIIYSYIYYLNKRLFESYLYNIKNWSLGNYW